MGLKFTDMQGGLPTRSSPLVSFQAGPYVVGNPQRQETQQTVVLNQDFGTFRGEVTNADVRQIVDYMTSERQYGLFGLDRRFGPILVATSPDYNKSHFEMVDPKLYPSELGITDWDKQKNRFADLNLWPDPIRIIPHPNRYNELAERWRCPPEKSHLHDEDEMAATVLTWWEAKALAMFMAGAKGLDGTSDLLSSDQFSVMAHGLTYMTRTGALTELQGWDERYVHTLADLEKYRPLRICNSPKITPVEDPKYPDLKNGLRPNTVWNWTRTIARRKILAGTPYVWDDRLPFLTRGGAWDSGLIAVRIPEDTHVAFDDCPYFNIGFRVAIADR